MLSSAHSSFPDVQLDKVGLNLKTWAALSEDGAPAGIVGKTLSDSLTGSPKILGSSIASAIC